MPKALPIGVLLREGEDERGQLTKGGTLMARVDATLRLTEEDHIGRQGEVLVIFQRVPAKEFGRLRHVIVLVRMATADDDHVVEKSRREVPFGLLTHCQCRRANMRI